MSSFYKLVPAKIKAESLVKLHDSTYSTIGHAYRLKKQQARTLVRRFHLPIRACNNWNNLLGHIVEANSVEIFKKNLDSLWQSQQYDVE